MTITFAQLCERLGATGMHVGLSSDGDGLAILLEEPGAGRVVRHPVDPAHNLDRAATCLVLSGALRECLAMPRPVEPGFVYRGRWPEFAELWPVAC